MMAAGYGFGAEGDWKTSALVRAMKVMATGLGGASFLEDYTYNFDPAAPSVLGAHMLEICPSIAKGKPRLEVHPLGIGGKADPARLVFAGDAGPALNATLVDMGGRMRMIVNEVDAIEAKAMPKLPVARVLLKPRPDLERAAECWIIARRRPPHRLLARRQDRVDARLGRDGRHRVPPHRRQDRSQGAPQGDPLERDRLPARAVRANALHRR